MVLLEMTWHWMNDGYELMIQCKPNVCHSLPPFFPEHVCYGVIKCSGFNVVHSICCNPI